MIASLGMIFVFGLLGSWHCVLMCSPLCSASCQGKKTATFKFLFFRFCIYVFWGLLVGILGAFAFRFLTSEIHYAVSLFCALLYFFYGMLQINARIKLKKESKPARYNVSYIISKSPFSSATTAGILTGLLPCGFLSLALIQAGTLANPIYSAAAMGVFALATSPALWGGQKILFFIAKKYSLNIQNLTTYLFIISASLLTLRASYQFVKNTNLDILCHR